MILRFTQNCSHGGKIWKTTDCARKALVSAVEYFFREIGECWFGTRKQMRSTPNAIGESVNPDCKWMYSKRLWSMAASPNFVLDWWTFLGWEVLFTLMSVHDHSHELPRWSQFRFVFDFLFWQDKDPWILIHWSCYWRTTKTFVVAPSRVSCSVKQVVEIFQAPPCKGSQRLAPTTNWNSFKLCWVTFIPMSSRHHFDADTDVLAFGFWCFL